jgi:hypothetical protein
MRKLFVAIAVLAGVLCPIPATAQICAPFTDVLASSGFCTNIQWMYNRGITTGCTATTYCPAQFVRRDQIAAFMNRLADSLFPLTCTSGQVMKWNGTAWACAQDATGGGGGGVTSIIAGTGLTGGTITSSGTIAVDAGYVQRRVGTSCAAGSSIRAIAGDGSVTCETDDSGPANAFVRGGNAFGAPTVIGTIDNQPLDVRVNNSRVMRFEPGGTSPNVIGGLPTNLVGGGVSGATIAGGGGTTAFGGPFLVNFVSDDFGTVGGGYWNGAGDDAGSTSDARAATVGGGYRNRARGLHSTIGGGENNIAEGEAATIAGGSENFVDALIGDGFSTVGGGQSNTAGSSYSTVAGGVSNTASGPKSTVGGGEGNVASGAGSTVPGGDNNEARGTYSVALGQRAKALYDGNFVFADDHPFDFATNVPNNFRVRATGGVRFVVGINTGTGATTWSCGLVNGDPGWVCSSDRNQKQDLERLDGQAVLDKLVAMPVYAWSPKGINSHVRHYGPTAQDFHAAFGLGDTDLGIGQQDADGVALAAIQGLNAKLEAKLAERDAEMALMRAELAELRSVRAELAAIRAMLADRPTLAAK